MNNKLTTDKVESLTKIVELTNGFSHQLERYSKLNHEISIKLNELHYNSGEQKEDGSSSIDKVEKHPQSALEDFYRMIRDFRILNDELENNLLHLSQII